MYEYLFISLIFLIKYTFSSKNKCIMYTVRKVQPYKICFFTFHTFFLLNREGAARDGALSILFP